MKKISKKTVNKEESETYNMASCMLSILDSLKLYDQGSLIVDDETLSEIMFRKMKAYNIDLNKELDFKHLKPVKKNERKFILPQDVISALLKTSQAYQGIGDFESTGENMVSVVGDVRKVLKKYGIDWKKG